MTFNPMAVPQGTFIWEHYRLLGRRPRLSTLPDGDRYKPWQKSDLDKLIKYVIILADPESPLYNENDYEFRVKQAADQIKLTNKPLQEALDQGPLFHLILLEIFKLSNSYQYETWFSLKMNFHILNAELRKQPEMFDAQTLNARRQLAGSMEDTMTSLAKIEASLFPSRRLEKIVNNASLLDEVGGWAEEFSEEAEWKQDVQTQE